MSLRKQAAIAVIISLFVVQSVAGIQPAPMEPLPRAAFRSVELYEPTVSPTKTSAPTPSPSPVPTVKLTARPAAPNAVAKVYVTPKPTLKPVKTSGRILTGVASYYCNANASRGPLSRCRVGYPDGRNSYYAAIRKDLNNKLRGKTVNVCVGNKCLPVKIIDCNCGPNPNLIDLYGDAFAYFYPLTKGKFKVTVKW